MKQTPSLNVGYFAQTLDGFTGFQGGSVGIGLPLYLPANQSKVQVQEAKRNQQLLQLDLASQRYREAVEQAWQNYEFRREALDFYQGEVRQEAEVIRQVAEQRYQSGEMPFIDVLRLLAQTASWNEEHLEARYRLRLSIISLSYLIPTTFTSSSNISRPGQSSHIWMPPLSGKHNFAGREPPPSGNTPVHWPIKTLGP